MIKAQCLSCKKLFSNIQDTVVLKERLSGVLTGKAMRLCYNCEKDYFKGEVKKMDYNLSAAEKKNVLMITGTENMTAAKESLNRFIKESWSRYYD